MMINDSSTEVVRTRVEGPVGHLLLNRPAAMNAITVEFGRELECALAELATTANVIVVRGAGGNFSVGGDFYELERLRAEGPEALQSLFENFGRACRLIGKLPVPVVAAVEGCAMAGGFELMQSCDVAIVRSDAKIADNHVNFGQVPGGGGSQRLPRLVGAQRALGHMLSGERLTGDRAVEWGLAYRSYPADEFETALATFVERIGKHDRTALGKIKELVLEGLSESLEQGLDRELETVVRHVGGASAGAGIESFRKAGGA